MKKVLLLGSGDRMRYGILPALSCLSNSFEIVAICSRSPKEFTALGAIFRTATTPSLAGVDFRELDLIVVAVSTGEVANVLSMLSAYPTRHITLMLDTPVLSARHLLAARYFKNFKTVGVSEDSIMLPPFVLAKRMIDDGLIGAVHNIRFSHNAFRYHALAAMRLFLGEPRSIAAQAGTKIFQFKTGTGFLEEPMRREGAFRIEGDKGSIGDSPDALHQIGYLQENGIYRGLTLNGNEVPRSEHDELYARTIDNTVFEGANKKIIEYSLLNSMKIRALVDLIPAALRGEIYPPKHALFDALSITIAEKYGRFDSRYMPLSHALRLLTRARN